MAIITSDSDKFKNVMANLGSKNNLPKDTTTPALEKINSTLIKILETIKGGSGVTSKSGFKSKDDNEEMSGLDKLKFIFGGMKSLGKGVKESVRSTFFNKPEAAPVMTSAEALEAKDALNQPKQVEVDQLKVAEETKDTQKEILKELKKLNDTTEDKSSGDGGLPSLPDLPGKLGKGSKASTVGKAAGAGSKLGIGAMGGVAAGAAAVGLIGGLTYLGFRKDSQIAETKDEAAVKKAEMDQRLASGAASIEEATGSGLSKEDELFQSTFLTPKKSSSASSESTPQTVVGGTTVTSSTPALAPSSTKVGGAVAATVGKSPLESKPLAKEVVQGDANLEEYQMAKAELQGLQKEYSDAKFEVQKEFGNKKETRGSPEHIAAKKAVDEKYLPLIEAQKKEVEKLSKAPGVKEAAAREKEENKSFFEGPENSTVSKRVQSADAAAAQKEMTGLEGKHEKEREQTVAKLQKEGKIKEHTIDDYENVPELKALTAKQEKERADLQARIDSGTSSETSTRSKVSPPAPSLSTEVTQTSVENQALRDEITTSKGISTPIVSNNVTNTSTNNYVPIKADPRPNSRGSALDNYVGRITSY